MTGKGKTVESGKTRQKETDKRFKARIMTAIANSMLDKELRKIYEKEPRK